MLYTPRYWEIDTKDNCLLDLVAIGPDGAEFPVVHAEAWQNMPPKDQAQAAGNMVLCKYAAQMYEALQRSGTASALLDTMEKDWETLCDKLPLITT